MQSVAGTALHSVRREFVELKLRAHVMLVSVRSSFFKDDDESGSSYLYDVNLSGTVAVVTGGDRYHTAS